jgi:hypothetical protein
MMHPDDPHADLVGLTFEQLIRDAAATGLVEDARGREAEWIAERILHRRQPKGSSSATAPAAGSR